jgi:hypothetical protein
MKAIKLTIACLGLAATASASPPLPLPWVASRFNVQTESGAIEFTMECPEGALSRLTATRGDQTAHFPIERLSELSLSKACSGVSTRASRAEEGLGKTVAIELTVELSHEYIVEQLRISFDPQRFEFTEAMRLLTYPGEQTQVTRIKLQ